MSCKRGFSDDSIDDFKLFNVRIALLKFFLQLDELIQYMLINNVYSIKEKK